MGGFTLWDIVHGLLLGLRWTVLLALVALLLGGAVGVLLLFMRVSRLAFARRVSKAYIEVFQGTPLLMQLFIVFFGLALWGIDVPPWLAAAVALTLFTSAFLSEIWRGCVEAVPRGQWEASSALALTYSQQMWRVVMPQAARLAIAPTVGFSVQVVKATAVTSIIGFSELTRMGGMVANATYQPFLVYSMVAVGYFLLCYPLSLFSRRLERNLHAARHH